MTVLSTALDTEILSRWQFGITTVYHFVLVPLTIGMSLLLAIMQTMWYRSGKEHWLKATRFFGKLFLINFALGVATGIVQEFQFGMNWSEYSRAAGNVFGGPLAFEALLSFFLESTFLGLWIFGWSRLSKKAHLVTIWMVALGVNTSALWIIGANSWMQHPVGATFDPSTGRAELNGFTGFLEVISSPVFVAGYIHVITSAWLLCGTFIAGLSIWWMVRAARNGGEEEARNIWRPIARFGLLVLIIGGIGTAASGHIQGQILVQDQPSKMAAAEALCATPKDGAPFTIFAFGPLNGTCEQMTKIGEVPHVTSLLATNSFTGKVEGLKNLNEKYAPGIAKVLADRGAKGTENLDLSPDVMLAFWSFRFMMLFGVGSAVLAVWGLYALRGGRITTSTKLAKFAAYSLPMPFIGISFGWMFTEFGRQPFIIYPLSLDVKGDSVMMLTAQGVSFAVPGWQVLLTMSLFTVLYGALGIVWFILMRRYAREGLNVSESEKLTHGQDAGKNLSFAY